ncbi:MAG: lysophospholipid acyltransferase family protein [Gemmatimonadaceae bacterium]
MSERNPPHGYPSARHPLLRTIGRTMMRLGGWKVAGEIPPIPKFVLIVAPHTSNWDFIVGVFVKFALEVETHWFGKDSLFHGPLGAFMRMIGGRPVHRDSHEGVVAEVAAMFAAEDRFMLALAPEGTRRRVDHWRTGFYHIARAAGVPIVPVAFDWSRREVRILPTFQPTGDTDGDIARLQALYRPEMGYTPSNFVAAGALEGQG